MRPDWKSYPFVFTIPREKLRMLKPRRFTVLYQGPGKSGKTHNLASWPNPGVLYSESNRATIDKFGIPRLLSTEYGGVRGLESTVLPMLEHRRAEEVFKADKIETIGLDSISATMMDLVRDIQGAKSNMSMQDFGLLLTRGETLIRRLVELNLPKDGHPGYNVVMTVHERDVTDENGGLVKVTPAIVGQLKDLVARWFDTVLLTRAEVQQTVEIIGGQGVEKFTKNHFVWTVPPSRHYTCGDGVGGGDLQELPPKVGGTYPELVKAWGYEEPPSTKELFAPQPSVPSGAVAEPGPVVE